MDVAVDLNAEEVSTILELAKQLTYCPITEADAFCKQSKMLAQRLPCRARNMLQSLVNTGYLVVRGFECALTDVPHTPCGHAGSGATTLLARVQSLLVHALDPRCELIAYEAEGNGSIFQDIAPDPTMSRNQTSHGSTAELEIHTEQAFSKLRPDILSLACLRGDPSAYTYLLPVSAIRANLGDADLSTLAQPLWKTGVDMSFKLHGHEFLEGDVRGPMAILEGPQGTTTHERLTFDNDLMFGITAEAEALKKKIANIYYAHRHAHCLQPGTIILIDNCCAVHGRSPFTPRYDGKDRFLVRCFGTLNYAASAHARPMLNPRVVQALYS